MDTTYTTEYGSDTYEITADFAQASCPVDGDLHGRQVADFRHSPSAAMRSLLEETIRMGGDDPEDYEDEIAAALEAMAGRNADLIEMAEMLERHGALFTGNHTDDEAQEWLDHDFNAESADPWCEIGVWDASVAAQLRDAGLSPREIADAAESLIADLDDPSEEYTDGSPIYSVCNCDTDIDDLIDAAKRLR